MAYDNFPALFRGRRDFLRLRDGADARHPDSQVLWTRGFHHSAPLGEFRESDAGDRPDGHAWLHHGSLHVVVQRRQVRHLYDVEPHVRALRAGLLAPDFLQRARATDSLVETDS